MKSLLKLSLLSLALIAVPGPALAAKKEAPAKETAEGGDCLTSLTPQQALAEIMAFKALFADSSGVIKSTETTLTCNLKWVDSGMEITIGNDPEHPFQKNWLKIQENSEPWRTRTTLGRTNPWNDELCEFSDYGVKYELQDGVARQQNTFFVCKESRRFGVILRPIEVKFSHSGKVTNGMTCVFKY